MITTLDLFLTSKNREIARSVLGFIKVCIISLPKETMLPRFSTLVPNLMIWSHEHKAHFKAKVKHIIERMIRRFGYEAVEKHVPEEDKKLVINIRKTRERTKRRKDATAANGDESGDEEDVDTAPRARRRSKFASEFEAAIYDSDSDVSCDSVPEADFVPRRKNKRGGKSGEAYIHEEADEPLDLLDRKSIGNISSTRPQRTRIGDVRKSATTKARTNSDGKLVFGGEGNNDAERNDEDAGMSTGLAPADGVSAYAQAITGKDAFVRGQRGRVKYSNKRGRHNGGDGGDGDSGDEEMEVDTEDRGGKGVYSSGGGGGGKKKAGKEMSGRKGLGVKSVREGRVGKSPRRKGRR